MFDGKRKHNGLNADRGARGLRQLAVSVDRGTDKKTVKETEMAYRLKIRKAKMISDQKRKQH